MKPPARALSIAGSDSGGGAGIQADLKTFAAHGVYGMTVVTAVTAQNTVGVRRSLALEADLVEAQLDAVLEDLGVDAVKVGMLGRAAVVTAVAGRLTDLDRPIVLDPVMVAKGGAELLDGEGVEALGRRLLPLSTLVTPNLPELERLAGRALGSPAERLVAARELAALGPAVLVKDGHGVDEVVEDVLIEGERTVRFRHPRLASRSTHGTGCTLSSAIAARLARGEALEAAVGGAIDYVAEAIRCAPGLGSGHGPLDHLHPLRAGGAK